MLYSRLMLALFIAGAIAAVFPISQSLQNTAFANPLSPQQMELRESESYDEETFATSKPAVGSAAPDMTLKTLDGKPVNLSSYRGKNIVVIKAGYT